MNTKFCGPLIWISFVTLVFVISPIFVGINYSFLTGALFLGFNIIISAMLVAIFGVAFSLLEKTRFCQ